MSRNKTTIILLLSVSLVISNQFVAASSNFSDPPFSVGSSCSTEASYEWTILSRTKWSMDMVTPFPTELGDPDEWTEMGTYRSRMNDLLNDEKSPATFADALFTAWPDFAGSSANVRVRFVRLISRTKKIVSCVNSAWSVQSETGSSDPDYSNWLEVGEQPHQYSQTNVIDLTNALEFILNRLNGQPGSDTSVLNTYTEME